MYRLKHIFVHFSVQLCCLAAFGQSFLNGSFENNNLAAGSDLLDMSNAQFNSHVPDCQSFGAATTNIDMITTDTWDALAQDGDWYVGIEGGGIDQFSLTLDQPLVAGNNYTLVFYDCARANNGITPVEIGVSTSDNAFGTPIYSAPPPLIGHWSARVVNFVAPVSGQFITVRAHDATRWVKVDNFNLCMDSSCIPEMPFVGLSMPNIFTPDADGVNDLFVPVQFEGIAQGTLSILNRWGTIVFETNELLKGWDGWSSDKPVSEGVYYWIVEYTDVLGRSNTLHGFCQLVR